jgi:sarcosine oxidase subunit alpha
VSARGAPAEEARAATTARPPTRPITLEEVAAGLQGRVQHHTRLHERHLALGARMDPAAEWLRPSSYTSLEDEYWAVRSGVSMMDVGTLGKYLVGGPDAVEFLERIYPCRVGDLGSGRMRYGLPLDETGFVRDDGIICALGDGRWYLTFTSGGASHAEAWLHDWREEWGLDVHIANRTAALGAINVAGPGARLLLAALSHDDFSKEGFPYLRHVRVTVAGVSCRAIRLGFVGELSYELHHPSSRSVELWDALLEAGSAHGLTPHGLETLKLLRLEKSHIIVGQDTDYDSTPRKLGMEWAVKLDKPWFVGKAALVRMAELPAARRLAPLIFEDGAPREGSPILCGGRQVGHLTSSGHSFVLGCGVGLGWVDASEDGELNADGFRGKVVGPSPYDGQGTRLRG